MVFPFNEQWNLIMNSSIFAEDATLSVDGVDIPLRGVFISGTFKEDSPAPYAPKSYVDREFFRFPLVQIRGKVSGFWKDRLIGAIVFMPERNRRFRVFAAIGKDNGDVEVELQEVFDGE